MDELTAWQLSFLDDVSNSHNVESSIIQGPSPDDELPEASKRAGYMRETEQLIQLGLFTDITKNHKETVEIIREQKNRSCMIVKITDNGALMFKRPPGRIQ